MVHLVMIRHWYGKTSSRGFQTVDSGELMRLAAEGGTWAIRAVNAEARSVHADKGIAALSTGQRTVISALSFLDQVCNGGLYQYFLAETGLEEDCEAALQELGLPEFAEIHQAAIARCESCPLSQMEEGGEGNVYYPRDEGEDFSDLDDRFYELFRANEEKFEEKLLDYILRNTEEFS